MRREIRSNGYGGFAESLIAVRKDKTSPYNLRDDHLNSREQDHEREQESYQIVKEDKSLMNAFNTIESTQSKTVDLNLEIILGAISHNATQSLVNSHSVLMISHMSTKGAAPLI